MSSTGTVSYSSSPCNNNGGESASAELEYKLVNHRSCCPFNSRAPYVFKTEWDNFSRVCGSRTSHEVALNIFRKALIKECSEESEFNNELFNALYNALGDDCCKIVFQNKRAIIHFNDDHKSWGFATQVTSLDIVALKNKNEREDNLDFDSSAESTRSQFDHACVLFKRSNADFEVTDVTVVVELKLSNTSCSPFKVERKGGKDYILTEELRLPTIHGPLAQVLSYTLSHVHPCLTRNNIQGDDIPYLVLAGLKKGREGAHNKLHYVQGELHVPKSFGYPFEFSILRGNTFKEVDQAAASYINTLFYGAFLAEKIKTTKNGYPSAMLCSSEHKIKGSLIDDCKLIASPILDKERFPMITRIHQGELFSAVVSKQLLQVDESSREWIAREVMEAPACLTYKVVIKVSSLAVHRTLVNPLMAYIAFLKLTDVAALEETMLCVWCPCEISLITITRDLTELGFHNLKPKSYNNLGALWSGFCDLVERVLLPLAHKGVVHCDIRPGWDETHNIMTRTSDGVISMQIIDLESLANVSQARYLLEDPHSFHLGYDKKRADANALSFLWWQCVLMAFSWLRDIKSKDIQTKAFVEGCSGANIEKYFLHLSGDEKKELSMVAAGGAVSENTIKHHIHYVLQSLFKKKTSRDAWNNEQEKE